MSWFDRAKRALEMGTKARRYSVGVQSRPAARRCLAFESLEPRLVLSHIAPGLVDTPQTYNGALSGKIVFTSAGHGWQWSTTLNRYATDRGDNNEIVEDFGNQDQLTYYADYLLRAGATVVPMRPVGRQVNEVVLDNDSTGVTFSGSWSNSSSTRYYDEDYGTVADSVPYRFASTTTGGETSVATYTPNIPHAGFYPVYTWVLRGTDRTSQLYRINHTGGKTEIRVDHSKVGSGWVYLGTYHFNAGSSATLGSVQISNQAAEAGKVVIADAIRFGNGMGDFIWTGSGATTISGYPREDENSYHWIARMVGVGTSISTAIGSGTNNVSAPSNMAQYMFNGSFGDAVYIGIHSNAGGGRGARGLMTTDTGLRTPNQANLALYMGRQINQDFQNLPGVFEYDWYTGSTHTGANLNFGEIDLGPSAEMDATIIEIAFHDSVEDAAIMRDPKGRDQIARSMLQGTIEYFQNHAGLTNTTSLPTTPVNVRAISNASGEVTIHWAPGPTTPSSVYGAPATGYRVYASIDGYGFDGGKYVAGGSTTSTTLSGFDPARPYYFRVTAVNNGGESGPSEVVTALPSGGAKQVLIVNGFDRFDRTQNFRYAYAYTGDGLTDRVWTHYNNRFSYTVQVHSAIHAARPGVRVDSTSNEAVISGAVNLSDYHTVIWILGNESTVNETFNATEQTKVEQFIANGGNLFVSGSEIAWDLDRPSGPTAADRTFFEGTLKGNYVADSAGTYTVVPSAGGIFAGMSNFVFSSGASSTGSNAYSTRDDQFFNVSSADVISPQTGGLLSLSYGNGSGGAAIQVSGTGGRGSVVLFGFPFETITSASQRQNVMDRVLTFFNVSVGTTGIEIKTRVNGEEADTAPGPLLGVGESATFTYVVSNTGDLALSNVVVVDDNGTPGNAADDFNPSYTGGDTNGDGLLDVGESWTYSATRSVVAGQQTHTGTVSGQANSQMVMASDSAYYFGATAGIGIQKLVNGQDADAPPGPTYDVGSTIIFSYTVTNAGNIALSNVVVVDDNGTPGNAADDFSPSYTGGDANGNGLLEVGESWTYVAIRTAVAGQQASLATVTANSPLGPAVSDSDAAHYFGALYGIAIQKLVNGQDANAPPGPAFVVGSTATFTYVVSNTGNVPLREVLVVDNNGTPTDGGDDFEPTLVGGDGNGNGWLDVGEVWTYEALHTVTLGQHASMAMAIGEPDGVSVTGSDGVYYVGVVEEDADFNGDSLVDGADYVLWRKHSGTSGGATRAMGDANGDGLVDGSDYDIWYAQFGSSPAAAGGAALATPAARDTAFSAYDTEPPLAISNQRRVVSQRIHLAVPFERREWANLLTVLSKQQTRIHKKGDPSEPSFCREPSSDERLVNFGKLRDQRWLRSVK
jgi:hypothetical protein